MTAGQSRLLYVATEDWFFASHFLPMAKAARKTGLQPVLASRLGDAQARLEAAGIETRPLAIGRRSLDPLSLRREAAALQAVIGETRPRIVHLIGHRACLLGALLPKTVRSQARFVFALTGLGQLAFGREFKTRAARALLLSLMRRRIRKDGWILLIENEDDARLVLPNLQPEDPRITLVGGAGVDPDRFGALPEPESEPEAEPVVAALVARMLRPKGIEDAVEAVRHARQRGTALSLLLAGTPDPENPSSLSEAELRALSGHDGIDWLGGIDDVRSVWARAHIAVLPSWREGLPLSLLEAAACARPLVTADVPGCRRLVRHGVEGLLVPPRDSEALCAALTDLAGDAERRRAMGQAARKRVLEGFTHAHVEAAVGGLYRRLLETG